MKNIIYMTAVILAMTVAYLTVTLKDHPFDVHNMAQAYRMGCNFGSRPLDLKDIEECDKASSTFGNTLDHIIGK